jgi:hypothetical protein
MLHSGLLNLQSAQHVSGTITPIIRSSRLYRWLRHLAHNTLFKAGRVVWCGAVGYASGLRDIARCCSTVVYKLVWHIPLLSVQWINSWWWTDELSETCRVSYQNKFVKLVHLVGFIIKKFVAMQHGHTNVKKPSNAVGLITSTRFGPRQRHFQGMVSQLSTFQHVRWFQTALRICVALKSCVWCDKCWSNVNEYAWCCSNGLSRSVVAVLQNMFGQLLGAIWRTEKLTAEIVHDTFHFLYKQLSKC